MNFKELSDLKIQKYGEYSEKALRPHRAISWGLQAEKAKDLDQKFVFYWIAFNS